jgi:hypothetical protein
LLSDFIKFPSQEKFLVFSHFQTSLTFTFAAQQKFGVWNKALVSIKAMILSGKSKQFLRVW